MTLPVSMPQNLKIVEALTPQVGAAVTGDYVSLKNAHKCWVVVHVGQGDAAQMTISIEQAPDVAPTSSIAIAVAVPIWSNLDCAATDTLVERTAAINYQLDVGVKHKIVVFEIDPATLTAGYDCITVKTGASHADNLTSAMYYLAERYQQATPPSAIID